MTPPDQIPIDIVLLDIEGTTTPVAFVHDTLFSYVRDRLHDWMVRHADSPALRGIEAQLAAEHRKEAADVTLPGWPPDGGDVHGPAEAYARWLMVRDRKSPGLKELQGLIWEEGYQAGDLRGIVYDDVPPALRRWHRMGLGVAIYSSGSELAQRRLFESTLHGDLTPLITAFFDTRVGAKVAAGSYRRIAEALGCRAGRMLFVSDVTLELAAASAAGCVTRLIERPGNAVQPGASRFPVVASFDDVLPEHPGAVR